MADVQGVFDPVKYFEAHTDIPMLVNVKKWIETFSTIDNITGIKLDVDYVELIIDKDGDKVPNAQKPFIRYVALETCKVTIAFKDNSDHSIGCITKTGEIYKLGG